MDNALPDSRFRFFGKEHSLNAGPSSKERAQVDKDYGRCRLQHPLIHGKLLVEEQLLDRGREVGLT